MVDLVRNRFRKRNWNRTSSFRESNSREESFTPHVMHPYLENGVKLLEIISSVKRFHRVNGTIFRGFPFHGEERSARTSPPP